MDYCGRHDIKYRGDRCPRCVADERHRDLLDQAREGAEEAARALEESDYHRDRALEESDHRGANPGDYTCPSCQYRSLRMGASRCPLCQGQIPADYWAKVLAAEKAAETQRRAKEAQEAAEWARNAPAREAAARAAAAARGAAARSAQIVAVEEEIAACQKTIGLSVGAVVATFLLAFGSQGLANQHANTSPPNLAGCLHGLLIALGCLSVIVFGLGLYAAVPIAAITIVVQLVRIGVRKGRIAKLRSGADG
jgi:hypothetical protein